MAADISFEAQPDPDVQAARSGYRAAFERLVARFQTDVFNLCLRFTGDFDTADDAAQETFIAALRAISRFRGGNFRSWLCRIATNKCRDQYRASARRRQVPLEDGVDPPPDSFVGIGSPDPTPEQYLDLQALHSVIQAGFQSAPAQATGSPRPARCQWSPLRRNSQHHERGIGHREVQNRQVSRSHAGLPSGQSGTFAGLRASS